MSEDTSPLTTSLFRDEFSIPSGFIWGVDKVPYVVRLLTPYEGNELTYITHDFLYSVEGPVDMSRAQADRIFYNDLRGSGVGRVRACMSHLAMRLCGGKVFRK